MAEKKGIVYGMNRLGDQMEKVLNVVAAIMLGIIAIAVIILVLGREINIPVVWLDEISTYAVIWAIFFGLALGYKNGLFPKVDIICAVLPKSVHKYLGIFWDLVGAVMLTMILWSGKDYILHTYSSGTTSAQLKVPLYLVYSGPMIGYLFTLYFTIVNIVNQIAALGKKGEKEA
ncbi:MAG: TRAP transporter small permease [Anaerotruncus sp.]|jgi:C4-dicarboxylate transporter DctQ subunit|nr:TRAP transporter small permease [Anaerotruncus sp.]